jgi:60 kDa SS-A/Ro ribonucleoprotein
MRGPLVWKAIARQMGPQALRMNLNTLARHEVLADRGMVEYVANRIADADEIRRSRQFPYQYLAAYLTAGDDVPQKIKAALHRAAEIACGKTKTVALRGRRPAEPDPRFTQHLLKRHGV